MIKRKNDGVNNTLLIFIKNPIKGQVKTRLASSVGNEEALRIYNELLSHTRKEAGKVDCNKLVCYSHYIEDNDEWQKAGFIPYLQHGGDLGERMSNAFQEALVDNDKVVIIGSDCPQISTAMIQTAFDALSNNKIVIGPTLDGGYYLLGMSRFFPKLFQDIEWSTDSVCQATIQKAKKTYQITPSMLLRLSDVDYIEDWKKYGW
ncbi:MAG: rSAM/selenodomain-associated transferase 1 [Maribacter sp.]|jgi:rSAM/selenodomain-associated transferase 1